MAALPLQNKMSNRSTKSTEYQGVVINFEQGWSQRITRGPAASWQRDSWVITYEQISKAEMLTVKAFLDGIGNWDLFEATFSDGTATEKKYRVSGPVSHTTIHDNNHTITFPIIQELA